MKSSTKIWLIIAALMILAGIVIFGGAMTVFGWNFTKLSTEKNEINTYEINENIKNITVECSTADLEFLPSDDGKISVVCFESENEKHEVKAEGDNLTIKKQTTKKWYEHIISINFNTPKITVYLPEGEYGNLFVRSSTGRTEIAKGYTFEDIDISQSTGSISLASSAVGDVSLKTTTGAIAVENMSAKNLELSVSTGMVNAVNVHCEGEVSTTVSTGMAKLSEIECNSLSSKGSTGDIYLDGVIAKEKISVKRDTGKVKLTATDAAEIYIKTDTGDVTGTILSEKVFIVETDTGSVNVPKTTSGGKCEIITDTGDIKIKIEKR